LAIQIGIDCWYALQLDPNLFLSNGGWMIGRRYFVALAALVLKTGWDVDSFQFQETIDIIDGDAQTPKMNLWTNWQNSGDPLAANVMRSIGGLPNAYENQTPDQWPAICADKDDTYARQNSQALVGADIGVLITPGLRSVFNCDRRLKYLYRWMHEANGPLAQAMAAAFLANNLDDAVVTQGIDQNNAAGHATLLGSALAGASSFVTSSVVAGQLTAGQNCAIETDGVNKGETVMISPSWKGGTNIPITTGLQFNHASGAHVWSPSWGDPNSVFYTTAPQGSVLSDSRGMKFHLDMFKLMDATMWPKTWANTPPTPNPQDAAFASDIGEIALIIANSPNLKWPLTNAAASALANSTK
jgi:hypothetical protein